MKMVPAVLKRRDFRSLWCAQVVSIAGDRLTLIAIPVLALQMLGGVGAGAVVLIAQMVPMLLAMLFGGVWADKVERHRLMVLCDLARFLLHGLLAVTIFTGVVNLATAVVIEVLFGFASAFFLPASRGLLPQTVPPSELRQANAMIGLSRTLAEFIGFGVGTVIVVQSGVGAGFAVDACTFLVSAAFLVTIRPAESPAATADHDGGTRKIVEDLKEGFQEVSRRTWLWVSLIAFSVMQFAGLAPWLVLGARIADENYDGVAMFGIVAAALGLGAVVGSCIAHVWAPRYPVRSGLILLFPWPALGLLYGLGAYRPFVVALALIAGAGMAVFAALWSTAIAERVPGDRLSRVSAYEELCSEGLVPLGIAVAAPLAAGFGASSVMVIGSSVTVVAVGIALAPTETRMLPQVDGPG